MPRPYLGFEEHGVAETRPAPQGSGMPVQPGATINVVHTITGTTMGGAQMMLYRLLARGNRQRFDSSVLTLLQAGPVGDWIRDLGVPLLSVGMRQHRPLSPALLRVIPIARSLRPSLVQGWMYHGNLTASLCTLLSPARAPVIWNVRHSIHDLQYEGGLTQRLIRLGAALSSKPHTIIYNARISADQHERLGYDPSKTVVIPNGFDCTLLRPRPEQGDWLRHELGIPATRTVVGMVARNHPQKDVGNVVRALSLLAEGGTDVHFVITGPGFDAGNAELTHLLGEAGIGDRVTRLGQRKDIPDLVPGFDLLVLPSAWGEGFPNALGEAMACGVPCVTTDVGDSAWIVGTSGIVVPPSNPEALAEGLGRLVALGPDGRRQLGEQARQRVIDNFEIDDIVSRYEGLYEEAISSRGDAT